MLQEAGHIKNAVVLILRHIQSLHLMNSEVAWVLVSSGRQVQSQITLDPDYIPDYLPVSYNYDQLKKASIEKLVANLIKNYSEHIGFIKLH